MSVCLQSSRDSSKDIFAPASVGSRMADKGTRPGLMLSPGIALLELSTHLLLLLLLLLLCSCSCSCFCYYTCYCSCSCSYYCLVLYEIVLYDIVYISSVPAHHQTNHVCEIKSIVFSITYFLNFLKVVLLITLISY